MEIEVDEDEKEETLDGWLKEESRLERLQELFIQENTGRFLEMLKQNAEKGEMIDNIKSVFCEKIQDEFNVFCENKFKDRFKIKKE
jgi:hypothetical protein